MARRKIVLVGGGQIGGTLAHPAMTEQSGDIASADVVIVTAGVPPGRAPSVTGPIWRA